MTGIRSGWALPVLFAVCAVSAAGDSSEWQTVKLAHGITMDVPTVIGDDYKPSADSAKKGGLMYFGVTTDHSGDLSCLLTRGRYTKKFSRATAVERLADKSRDAMCYSGDDTTGAQMGESESLSVSGYPAGRCAESYTEASYKQPGQVTAVMTVAAPDAFYMLSCTVYTTDQDEATAEWMARWADEVHHVQESVRLQDRDK
jgi:hypothetical protein